MNSKTLDDNIMNLRMHKTMLNQVIIKTILNNYFNSFTIILDYIHPNLNRTR